MQAFMINFRKDIIREQTLKINEILLSQKCIPYDVINKYQFFIATATNLLKSMNCSSSKPVLIINIFIYMLVYNIFYLDSDFKIFIYFKRMMWTTIYQVDGDRQTAISLLIIRIFSHKITLFSNINYKTADNI